MIKLFLSFEEKTVSAKEKKSKPYLLTLPVPILDKEKIKLNFYFHNSL